MRINLWNSEVRQNREKLPIRKTFQVRHELVNTKMIVDHAVALHTPRIHDAHSEKLFNCDIKCEDKFVFLKFSQEFFLLRSATDVNTGRNHFLVTVNAPFNKR